MTESGETKEFANDSIIESDKIHVSAEAQMRTRHWIHQSLGMTALPELNCLVVPEQRLIRGHNDTSR